MPGFTDDPLPGHATAYAPRPRLCDTRENGDSELRTRCKQTFRARVWSRGLQLKRAAGKRREAESGVSATCILRELQTPERPRYNLHVDDHAHPPLALLSTSPSPAMSDKVKEFMEIPQEFVKDGQQARSGRSR